MNRIDPPRPNSGYYAYYYKTGVVAGPCETEMDAIQLLAWYLKKENRDRITSLPNEGSQLHSREGR